MHEKSIEAWSVEMSRTWSCMYVAIASYYCRLLHLDTRTYYGRLLHTGALRMHAEISVSILESVHSTAEALTGATCHHDHCTDPSNLNTLIAMFVA